MSEWANLHSGLEREFGPCGTAVHAKFAKPASFAVRAQIQVSLKFQVYIRHSEVLTLQYHL